MLSSGSILYVNLFGTATKFQLHLESDWSHPLKRAPPSRHTSHLSFFSLIPTFRIVLSAWLALPALYCINLFLSLSRAILSLTMAPPTKKKFSGATGGRAAKKQKTDATDTPSPTSSRTAGPIVDVAVTPLPSPTQFVHKHALQTFREVKVWILHSVRADLLDL